MGKPNTLTRRSGNERSGAEERIFKPGQLLLLDVEPIEDIDIEGIDCAQWKKDSAGLLVVPNEHINNILRQCHDSKAAGHWGRTKTQELVSRNFTWDNWKRDVMNYVATCKKCQKGKSDRHSRQTKTIPMPTGNHPFEEIAMDFVRELPESEGYNAIL